MDGLYLGHCIFLLFQEAFEACHKRIRDIYERGSRCHDQEALEDIINKLILESDPSIRKPNFKLPPLHEDDESHPDVIMLVSIAFTQCGKDVNLLSLEQFFMKSIYGKIY